MTGNPYRRFRPAEMRAGDTLGDPDPDWRRSGPAATAGPDDDPTWRAAEGPDDPEWRSSLNPRAADTRAADDPDPDWNRRGPATNHGEFESKMAVPPQQPEDRFGSAPHLRGRETQSGPDDDPTWRRTRE